MSRINCQQCGRPEVACICAFITPIKNKLPIVILLHPREVNQSKGTLTLLERSLSNCQVIIGEDFSENSQLNEILSIYGDKAYLLYPHATAEPMNDFILSVKYNVEDVCANSCLILLDATWKKAYRMYMLSNNIQRLPKLQLPNGIMGHYKIRKTNKENALSTLEACCHALSLLESKPNKYQGLLNNFIKFNQFQLSFKQK